MQSDLITTQAAPAAVVSVSFPVRPRDSRCRYWAKVIRAGQPLPAPASVDGAGDVPGAYLRNGEEELFPGDVLIEGEANHHVKARGWSYWVHTCSPTGEQVTIRPSADVKSQLKAAGIDPRLLPGSGDVAACVRIAHGIRAGLI